LEADWSNLLRRQSKKLGWPTFEVGGGGYASGRGYLGKWGVPSKKVRQPSFEVGCQSFRIALSGGIVIFWDKKNPDCYFLTQSGDL